jgi:hypothetical protein
MSGEALPERDSGGVSIRANLPRHHPHVVGLHAHTIDAAADDDVRVEAESQQQRAQQRRMVFAVGCTMAPSSTATSDDAQHAGQSDTHARTLPHGHGSVEAVPRLHALA